MASSSHSSPSASGERKLNRLGKERSPYLLQHATNPVDWYPWGDEAVAKAKAEDKLIFLSVGYSTCHWCHVMERESFENDEVARIMNRHFVSIKVDREERPDVDRIYMTFIQATSGRGGWPASVWLTPDLKPLLGGTYFPPDDRYFGQPGFKTVLLSIARQWKENRAKLLEQGTRIVDVLRHASDLEGSADGGDGTDRPPDAAAVAYACYEQLSRAYDEECGGFGRAPKFPQCVNLGFLLRFYSSRRDSAEGERALDMCVRTLREMARGGIRDHVAQGFHRYSTDREWHVPHFEKMLYDQAQLARAYAEAYRATRHEDLARAARDVLRYVVRDLGHPSGGFFGAEDADSLPAHDAEEKREGAFYVWEEKEIRDLLREPVSGGSAPGEATVADVACLYYGVRPDGNVDPEQDPHDELKGKNVLAVRRSGEAAAAAKFGLGATELDALLAAARERLYEARARRPRPHRDEKFVASWNGLLISGLATAGAVLGDESYGARALRGVRFLRRHLYDSERKRLLRCAYGGAREDVVQMAKPLPGTLEDYAFVVAALLDTYEATFDVSCLEWAEELQETQDALFWDAERGGYFVGDPRDASLLLHLKDDQDGAEPSANSVSLSNLQRLAIVLNEEKLRVRARRLATAYGRRLRSLPMALPEMACGLLRLQAGPRRVVVAGEKDDPGTTALLSALRARFLPFLTVVLADGDASNPLARRLPDLDAYRRVGGKATAYVCNDSVCAEPVTEASDLEKLLAPE